MNMDDIDKVIDATREKIDGWPGQDPFCRGRRAGARVTASNIRDRLKKKIERGETETELFWYRAFHDLREAVGIKPGDNETVCRRARQVRADLDNAIQVSKELEEAVGAPDDIDPVKWATAQTHFTTGARVFGLGSLPAKEGLEELVELRKSARPLPRHAGTWMASYHPNKDAYPRTVAASPEGRIGLYAWSHQHGWLPVYDPVWTWTTAKDGQALEWKP